MTYFSEYYQLTLSPDGKLTVTLAGNGGGPERESERESESESEGPVVFDGLADVALHGMDIAAMKPEMDEFAVVSVEKIDGTSSGTRFALSCESGLWNSKTIFIDCFEGRVEIHAQVSGENRYLDRLTFFNSGGKSDAGLLYAPRFDWSRGIVHADIQGDESLSCQQWLSPPPFYYGLQVNGSWVGAGIKCPAGENNFLSFDYAGSRGPSFILTYEGHTRVSGTFTTPRLVLYTRRSNDENSGLRAYVNELAEEGLIAREERKIPSWWREPIFCGWGQQRRDYRRDHDGHEMGVWINAGDYAAQVFYEKHLRTLEENGIEPGIIIIDCFWSEKPGFAKPHSLRWPDMRSFIDGQHAEGRKVLLWFTPIICEGLSKECCMTVEGRPAAADPTSPAFIAHMKEQIRLMLSHEKGCLDADGFKIDFTQNIPAERGVFRNYLNNRWAIISEKEEKNYAVLEKRSEPVRLKGAQWGVEIIKEYLRCIRKPMKNIKPDSLLITHTANPYFAEDVDMLRLNDMDGTSPGCSRHHVGTVREIARSCHPDWLIDTDNDLMINKDMWRNYIALQRTGKSRYLLCHGDCPIG